MGAAQPLTETPMQGPRPFLKWAGGKRQLLPQILSRLPPLIDTYYEPFIGGGAVFFALAAAKRFEHAVISDSNACLVNVYEQVRDCPDDVLNCLRFHESENTEEHFYRQREMAQLRAGARDAARFIYLNRTCFNGLYRVNAKGEFNVAWGKYKNPPIVNVDGVQAASKALQGVEITCCDYSQTIARAKLGDAVYLDPPYLAVSSTASFSAFQKEAFGVDQHEALSLAMGEAATRGARVLLSNSDTLEARRIFSLPGRTVEVIPANRAINSAGDRRGPVGEMLVSIPVIAAKPRRAKAAPPRNLPADTQAL